MGERIKAHLGTGQVGRVIYGAIIGMSVIVVLNAHPPGPGSVVAALVATALAVALAELYSDIVATETRTRRRIGREHLREIGEEAAWVAFGIMFPAVFFVLAAAGAMETHTAFTIAKWSGVGLIGFYGFSAARLAGQGWPIAFLQGLAAAAIGGFLILFKALVH
jgi:VIT1/CCC1 family predicted Fe2+/Mn2+ transporter